MNVWGNFQICISVPLKFAPVFSKELLDIQATVERRITLKRVHDMIITYKSYFRFKATFDVFKLSVHDEIKLSKLYYSSDSYIFDILNLILVFLLKCIQNA